MLLLLFFGCIGQNAHHTPTTQKTPLGTAIFHTNGGDVRVLVEIADDPAERQRGLMYRERLSPDRGMVFIFPAEEVRSFWMRNTLISLDMIFIDAHKRVVGIVENTDPRTDAPRGVPLASRYVIEMVGGYSRDHRIEKGTPLSFENIPLKVSH